VARNSPCSWALFFIALRSNSKIGTMASTAETGTRMEIPGGEFDLDRVS